MLAEDNFPENDERRGALGYGLGNVRAALVPRSSDVGLPPPASSSAGAARQQNRGRLSHMGMMRAGQRYGEWVTVGERRLGGGGNGEVWRARNDTGQTGAIKVLQRRSGESRYRLNRFKDEISFLIAHPDFPGILPLLDSHISDDFAEPTWYVMPVAKAIGQAVGSDPEPATVVAAIAGIAATLEALAAEGVAHRDIKPDNPFELI